LVGGRFLHDRLRAGAANQEQGKNRKAQDAQTLSHFIALLDDK
jgi:hypothetical protein